MDAVAASSCETTALLTVISFCSYLFNTELGVLWSVTKTFASSDFTSDIHSCGKETYLHTLLDSIDYSSILPLLLHLCSAISPRLAGSFIELYLP